MNGWLYEIKSDGWFETKSKKKGFMTAIKQEIKESIREQI